MGGMFANRDWQCLWQNCAQLGEGPLWCPDLDSVCFVDVKRPNMLVFGLDGKRSVHHLPAPVSCIVNRDQGGLLALFKKDIAVLRFSPFSVKSLVTLESELPNNRFNDGKCDGRGRFWFASMDDEEREPTGDIWRISGDLKAVSMQQKHVVGNGFGWSPDGQTMYFTDSERRTIFAYPFTPETGELGLRRVFVTIPVEFGYPDGLTVDSEGGVWSAHWDGARITRYSPAGKVERVVPMPIPRPTSLAFGGEGLSRLFVTSAAYGLDDAKLQMAPLSGSLFEVDAGGVVGIAETPFDSSAVGDMKI